MITGAFIFSPLQSQIDDGCDYAVQTFKLLAKKNSVYVLLLSDPLNWKDILSVVIGKKKISNKQFGAYIYRPFLIIPFQRFSCIKTMNLWLNSAVFAFFCRYKAGHKRKFCWFFEIQHIHIVLPWFDDFFKIFDVVDHFFIDDVSMKKREYIFQKTDLIVVSTSALLEKYRKFKQQIFKVRLGFAKELFILKCKKTLRKQTYSNRKLVFGYVGGLNYRLDFDLLMQLIHEFSNDIFRFVGPLQLKLIPGDNITQKKIEELLMQSNVEYLPNQPKDEMPKIIESFDFCLIPYSTAYPFNQYAFPMKVMEYLFVGKPILSTPILELKTLSDVILIGNDISTFKSHIKNIIKTGWFSGKRKRQRQISLSHSWQRKITQISNLVGNASSTK